MPSGVYVRTKEYRQKVSERLKELGLKPPSRLGKHMPEEAKRKISQFNLGKKHSKETRRKISESNKGKGDSSLRLCYQRILREIPELEKQGFKCIPVGHKVTPDLIGIKDGKVYAIEVEYTKTRKPNYAKYTDEIKNYYDDVIWILRK